MTNKDIKKAIYNGNEVRALYWGGDLVYQRAYDVKHQIRGVWSDFPTWNDGESDGKPYITYNGVRYDLPIDEDKVFYFDSDEPLTYCSYMFRGHNLTSLDISNLDTSKVTNMSYMFYNCQKLESLDISNLDTSKVTNMGGMFFGSRSLKSLDVSNWDTSNVTYMAEMFKYCESLKRIDISNFDISKCTSLSDIFTNCTSLELVVLSGLDFDKATNKYFPQEYFLHDTSLTTVIGPIYNFKPNQFKLPDCPLTNASAMVFINGLAQVESTQTITFSKTTYDTLTPEQIAIATAKGWTVAA